MYKTTQYLNPSSIRIFFLFFFQKAKIFGPVRPSKSLLVKIYNNIYIINIE